MGKQEKELSSVEIREKIFIFGFCALVLGAIAYVLLFHYDPNQNTLRALASVCMDTFASIVLVILTVSLCLENREASQTTKLFMALTLATMAALFFDFMNWASDGSLEFGSTGYCFTVASICCGSILAGIFTAYLCSYMEDMYNLGGMRIRAKICVGLNAVSCLTTIALALTGTAFTYVDGHYETGVMYTIVEAIPILSVIYMTIYTIRHIKVIGWHDVVAVVAYNLTMITGALIESEYSIGTTYVGITIADIFIFVMLQDKMLERITKQGEVLSKRITSQFEILESMAEIYSYVNYVNLTKQRARRFDRMDVIDEQLDIKRNPHTGLNQNLYECVDNDHKERFLAFTDLSTLPDRMKGEKMISGEFYHKKDGWFRALYIRIGDPSDGAVNRVIYAVRNIDEEKRNVEKWIRKSNTDELTGFYNRHAYEEDLLALEKGGINSNFVYVSIDVNGLKQVNDTLGHTAGDELLLGACECMRRCYGSYGNLYRIGGDEFVALLYADEQKLEEIKRDVEETTQGWSETHNLHLTISAGYVTLVEKNQMPLSKVAVLADKRMYEAKSLYYQKSGIDRRGQKDAYIALSSLYTKVLKIDITDDSLQIINMNEVENAEEIDYSERISDCFKSFVSSGHVHPEDARFYLAKTDIEYLRDYFKSGQKKLEILYRRKQGDEYRKAIMEIVPANDYSDEEQRLFLFVKILESD